MVVKQQIKLVWPNQRWQIEQEIARRYFHLISSTLLSFAGFIEMQIMFISILNVRCHAITKSACLPFDFEYLSDFVFVRLLVKFSERNVLSRSRWEINLESLLMKVKVNVEICDRREVVHPA